MEVLVVNRMGSLQTPVEQTDHNASEGYAGRNVVNAAIIKLAIQERSNRRQDRADIRDWLSNHFWRYAVGNFTAPTPALQPITSLTEARNLFQPDPTPKWIRNRLSTESQSTTTQTLWWLDPSSAALLALEQHLLEFLLSRVGTPLDGKLMRINCPQALALSKAEHHAFAAKTAAGWREHQPEAIRTVWQGSNGRFVELLCHTPWLRHEMAYESQMMRHCLGQFADRKALTGGYGEHYASACEAGHIRLFSFRKDNDQPHITINVQLEDDGRLSISQIKGKQNRPPVDRYLDDVRDFLNSLPTTMDSTQDAADMGLVRLAEGWTKVTDVLDEKTQLQVVQLYPGLLLHLPNPTLLVQWAVAGIQPGLLHDLPASPRVQAALGVL